MSFNFPCESDDRASWLDPDDSTRIWNHDIAAYSNLVDTPAFGDVVKVPTGYGDMYQMVLDVPDENRDYTVLVWKSSASSLGDAFTFLTLGPEGASKADIDAAGGDVIVQFTTEPNASLCTVTFELTPSGLPIAEASCWVTTDPEGAIYVEGVKETDSFGQAPFMLVDGGTYYMWAKKDGVNHINGVAFAATAD